MEDIHGVDVSWLHHSNKEHHHRQYAPSSPGLAQDVPPKTSAHGGIPPTRAPEERKPPHTIAPAIQEPSLPTPPPFSTSPSQKTPVKRPALLGRGSSEKLGNSSAQDGKTTSRRNSWISSISSKFSSQNSPAQTTHAQAQGSPVPTNTVHGTTSSANGALNGIQAAAGGASSGSEPYVPQAPKSSFISNALRRLSSGSQIGGMGKLTPQGGVCPRKVMNVDQTRDRCLVPELDQNKLRRVAFCVDVEIAAGPRYKDDVDSEERKRKRNEKKLKERAEGEALKHSDTISSQDDNESVVGSNGTQGKQIEVIGDVPDSEDNVLDDEKKEPSRKKEKKKRSEAERKERKEKKRRKAEENGSIPLELTRENSETSLDGSTQVPETVNSRPQDRPTTDPLRIYRRCCQLRETPILKRISDQLSSPKCCPPIMPGVVTSLDLTGSRMQLADVITLSDWLAVVPVKKLFLEDADLTDEKVRVILAGLLAAKIPEGPKKRQENGNDGQNGRLKQEDRSGFIKKLVLKNNPKIGVEGWRHISLFIYMCKSIQAIDVSMIPFPKTAGQSPVVNSAPDSISPRPSTPKGIADILSKAISERLGGSELEELLMSECSLTSPSIRKIIDGVVISGVQRLGLAGNNIDNDGFGHVIHYIRSGVCQGLDLGGNDIKDWIPQLSESLTKDCPLWVLSLADCALTPESLKVLFPALVSLPTFRFLDLSHNKGLFSHQKSLYLLRKYMSQWKEFKRIHLMDVDISPEHAIGLAEVLPECTHLAHISFLENPKISAVATATDEATQEEAAALYASLMVASRLSQTLISVDVDVPGPDSNEVVKALAKQVIAYCLRNMENLTTDPADLSQKEKLARSKVEIPDVLVNLVGHSDDYVPKQDGAGPAPDDDYIVGGTGVVKALNYCLLQNSTDLRRQSLPGSGTATPRSRTENFEDMGKAKMMSKNLLTSARNIKSQLQSALVREAREGNEMGYRRLLFLDQTLQGMIKRFEDEYPDTRLPDTDTASTHSSVPSSSSPPTSSVLTLPTKFTDTTGFESDDDYENETGVLRSRHNSDVSLASRALSLQEGRLHRLGHRIRTDLINANRPTSSQTSQASLSGSMDNDGLPEYLVALREKMATVSGEDIRKITDEVGVEQAFDQIVDNADMLKQLASENPEEFARFRETQITALRNRNPDFHEGKERKDDFAVHGA